jgi:hypothetical protein
MTTGRYCDDDGEVWRLGKTILRRILILMPVGLILARGRGLP